MKKRGYLKNSIARATGFFSPTGEKLKGRSLTPEFIAEWNGVKKENLVVDKIEPTIDLEDLNKKELEVLARTKGVELDRRKNKKTLLNTVKGLFS